MYDELEEITGIERRTIQDYKTVSERTSAGRHADVSFSHHREVAPLEPEQQSHFLNKASEEKLSVRQLRESYLVSVLPTAGRGEIGGFYGN